MARRRSHEIHRAPLRGDRIHSAPVKRDLDEPLAMYHAVDGVDSVFFRHGWAPGSTEEGHLRRYIREAIGDPEVKFTIKKLSRCDFVALTVPVENRPLLDNLKSSALTASRRDGRPAAPNSGPSCSNARCVYDLYFPQQLIVRNAGKARPSNFFVAA
jgi:hypothetical protein